MLFPMNESMKEHLDRFLSSLDNAPLGDSAVFTNEEAKERYESLLSFALYKFRSAKYHYGNVIAFIESEDAEIEAAASRLLEPSDELEALPGRSAELKFTSRRSADEYGYELAAFLVDLKTGLDFLASISAYHLRGIETDSIRTLIKLVSKGKSSPILEVVGAWQDWLIRLRDYRHQLAHRLVIKANSGFILQRVGAHRPSTRLPVVVPERSPRFVFDTRKTRLQEFHHDEVPPPGIVLGEGRASMKLDDGSEEIVSVELDATPAPGFAAIDDFMRSHLDDFRSFVIELLHALEAFELEVIA